MDVKQYYRKIQEIESSLQDPWPIVVSVETADGGKPGKLTEVSRTIAAKMLVEQRAVLADAEQKRQYFEDLEAAQKAVEKAELAKRLQVAIVSEADLKPSTPKKVSEPVSGSK